MAITARDDVGADLVVAAALQRGLDVYRFNSEDYPAVTGLVTLLPSLDSAALLDPVGPVSLASAGIWIRRPQWPSISPEVVDPLDVQFAEAESIAGLGGMLRTLGDQCVSPPDVLQSARWKLPQLRIAASLGFQVPPTIVTTDPDRAREFAASHRCVVKAVADARVGAGRDERVGLTMEVNAEVDWTEARYAPIVVQHAVHKSADLRITIVGRRVFPVKIVVPAGSGIDFREADPGVCRYSVVKLPETFTDSLLRFLDHYGLRFGAFDFAIDERDEPWFLECNPAGQWGWLEAETGIPITATLVDLLLGLRR